MQYMFSKTIGPVRSQEKIKGLSLSYDDNTDLFWVGLNDSNTIFGYRIVQSTGTNKKFRIYLIAETKPDFY